MPQTPTFWKGKGIPVHCSKKLIGILMALKTESTLSLIFWSGRFRGTGLRRLPFADGFLTLIYFPAVTRKDRSGNLSDSAEKILDTRRLFFGAGKVCVYTFASTSNPWAH